MDEPGLADSELIERIFSASTLETAILWREIMLGRLEIQIDGIAQLARTERDALRSLQEARLAILETLGHLRLSLLNNERVFWRNRTWQTTDVWSPPTSD